ncbi:UNVERIFIED_CONTAM: hypothetical protein K2H54_065692 [Gekko kuhli]
MVTGMFSLYSVLQIGHCFGTQNMSREKSKNKSQACMLFVLVQSPPHPILLLTVGKVEERTFESLGPCRVSPAGNGVLAGCRSVYFVFGSLSCIPCIPNRICKSSISL